MGTADHVDVAVRDITDAEIETFFEQGWVKLPQLIDSDVAAGLLERAKERMGGQGDAHATRPTDHDFSLWNDYRFPSRDEDLFRQVATSRDLGRAAARLNGRPSSIRVLSDLLAVKLPISSKNGHADPTPYHQDFWDNPFDLNSVTFWIALDEVTPDQGSMQFYTGSHKLGLLGDLGLKNQLVDGEPAATPSASETRILPPTDGVDAWPRLRECPLSEPNHFLPGDATAHHSLVVHGAPANASDRPRWVYIIGTFPGDTLYTNQPSPLTDGYGFVPYQPLDHPDLPLIYTPGS
jgi:ectoine hydroxylase-related dioxygenase (phytanoyl-CoA dioxygenase family)